MSLNPAAAASNDNAGPQNRFAHAWAALNPNPSGWQPQAREAAALIEQGRFESAAGLLKNLLGSRPEDVGGLYLLAELARRRQSLDDAAHIFGRCVQLAPEFHPARFRHANTLLETGQPAAALAQAEELLKREPDNPAFLGIKAMALEMLDDFAASAQLWKQVVESEAPADCWVRYAHVLRTAGRRDECIAACRKALTLDPGNGSAYWALATLNTFRFDERDIADMEARLARSDISPGSRISLLFALGKANAGRELYEKSFSCYARGNALKRAEIQYDPALLTAYIERCKAVFTKAFFEQRAGVGCRSREPIFIVGMLRAGSTLVEQILSSHSQVEGTRELFILGGIAKRIQTGVGLADPTYPSLLERFDENGFETLGAQYLDTAGAHRKSQRPFFIDKMGQNFKQLGLLHLILPNAKIIDVRRHPLACCFSNFTQLYANGQVETYRLSDLGALYRDYVDLTAHFDRVLPGRVHRVFYERLVTDPEVEIRRLLAYLELPFEEQCLAFYNNRRAVSTVSSEQVRSPIYTGALEHWRHYEPWLGALRTALGSLCDAYPQVPANL